ncbi:hypothetical protein D3C86_1976990 [compost metagenome]
MRTKLPVRRYSTGRESMLERKSRYWMMSCDACQSATQDTRQASFGSQASVELKRTRGNEPPTCAVLANSVNSVGTSRLLNCFCSISHEPLIE